MFFTAHIFMTKLQKQNHAQGTSDKNARSEHIEKAISRVILITCVTTLKPILKLLWTIKLKSFLVFILLSVAMLKLQRTSKTIWFKACIWYHNAESPDEKVTIKDQPWKASSFYRVQVDSLSEMG